MSRPNLSKHDEIGMIEKLMNHDSYFSQEFVTDDRQVMLSNLQNDFPLFLGTSVGNKLLRVDDVEKLLIKETLNARGLKTEIAALENVIIDIKDSADNLLMSVLMDDPSSKLAYIAYPIAQIVKLKLKNNIKLIEEDNNFLISKI